MNKDEYLRTGERIDDLQRNGLYIIQQPERFCFGMDAVLLSGFAAEHASVSGGRILDLCTGSGIIAILMSAKTKADHITGMEIQKDVADMAERSIRLNSLEDRINIINCDIKEAADHIDAASFDMVTVNPPYFKSGHGIVNPADTKTISRHEVACTLQDVLRISAMALKEGGYFYMVHKPHRLADVIYEMRIHNIEPKTLKTVHPDSSSPSSMILLEGRKGAGAEMKVESPLIIYGEDGRYTKEMYTVYGY